MKKNPLSPFKLVKALKNSKSLLLGTIVSVSVFTSAKLFGQTCVVPTIASRSVCAGNTVQLTPTNTNPAGTTYEWYSAATGGSLLFTGNTYAPLLSATTTIHLASKGSGCPTTRRAVTVTVNPLPNPSITNLPSTVCSDALFDFNIIWGIRNTGTYTTPTTWNVRAGGQITGGINIQGSLKSSGTFTLIATTSLGCSKTVTASVSVNPAPISTFTADKESICKDDFVNLTRTSTVGTGTWSISTDPLPALNSGATQNSSISSTGKFTGFNPGIFTVLNTVTQTLNGLTCTSATEKDITVGALPFTILGPANVCQNGSAIYEVNQNQGGQNDVYTWSVLDVNNNTVNNVSLSGITKNSLTLNANNTTATPLVLTGQGKFYCIAGNTNVYRTTTTSLSIPVVKSPTNIRLKCADATCNTLVAVMKDGSSTAGLTFNWNNGSGTGTTFTNPKNSSSVNCEIKNSDGCSSYFAWYPSYTYSCNSGYVYDHNKALYCQQGFDPNNTVGCTFASSLRTSNSENSTYQLRVYPNPSSSQVSFESDGLSGSAIIYNIDGIALKTIPLIEDKKIYEIDLTTIPSGIYFLHIDSSNGKVYSSPLIKE